MKYVNKALSLPEIFKRVAAQPTVDEKINLLRQYDRKDVRWVVDFMYNADTQGLTIPEYKKSNYIDGMSYMTIITAIGKLQSAIQHRNNSAVYTRNLTVVLESLCADEAQLIVDLFEGKKIEGVSKKVFKQVYPNFFPKSDQTVLL